MSGKRSRDRGDARICLDCGKEKPIKGNYGKRGYRKNVCGKCVWAYYTQWREELLARREREQ